MFQEIKFLSLITVAILKGWLIDWLLTNINTMKAKGRAMLSLQDCYTETIFHKFYVYACSRQFKSLSQSKYCLCLIPTVILFRFDSKWKRSSCNITKHGKVWFFFVFFTLNVSFSVYICILVCITHKISMFSVFRKFISVNSLSMFSV